MPTQIPVECGRCGLLFPSQAFSMTFSIGMDLSGNREECPRCGAMAEVVSGIFDAVGPHLTVVQASPENISRVQRLKSLLEGAAKGEGSPSEVINEVSNVSHEVGELLQETLRKRPKLFTTLCAALFLLISRCEVGVDVDVSIDVNELIEQMLDLKNS